MKKTLFIVGLAAVLIVARSAFAENSDNGGTPTTKNFRQQVNTFKEQMQLMKQDVREEVKASNEAQRGENKETREQFRTKTKEMLLSTTPGQRKEILPTIKAQRKTMNQEIASTSQTLRKQNWARFDELRNTIRTSWTNLWNSFFGKK